MLNLDQFKNSMYDYSNIIEYYSYYGSVIYVSSSYYNNEDFFIVLRTPKELAVVSISQNSKNIISSRKNRDKLINDLKALEPTIPWIVPTGFNNYISAILTNGNFPDKSELIKLKNNDISFWNRFFIEDAIKKFKPDHTLLSNGINFVQSNKHNYTNSYFTIDRLYDTQFSLTFESVSGNPFFDVKIKYFSETKTRRLLYFDLAEFQKLLIAIASKDEQKIIQEVDNFVTGA